LRFTWEKTNPEIRCRLDLFLISESLCPNVVEDKIHPGYPTDHRMITVRGATIKYVKAKKSHSIQKKYILVKYISAIEKELDQQHLSEAEKESLHVALKLKRQ